MASTPAAEPAGGHRATVSSPYTEVQNIDLMNLAGFCRNCLAKWYRAEAEEKGVALDYEGARELIYGMPFTEWKARYQTEASPAQQAAFAAREAGKH